MVLLLDTDGLPERQRADAVQAAYRGESPQRVVAVGRGSIQHRIERLDLGPEAHLLSTGGTALQIIRTERHVRIDAPEYVAIGFRRGGDALLSTGGVDIEVPVGHLNCVDVTRPYRLTHRTRNKHDVLIISNRHAGVSVDTVRAAAPALARSPVYALVRGHLAGLFPAARQLTAQQQLLTGQATIALVRALLTTAAGTRGRHDAMEDALDIRISLYVDAHLDDHDLTAERIAAAHHISPRHLYNIWADAGHDRSLTKWIIDRRLQRARDRLAILDPARSSIEAVARDSGFANTSHFSRRFRQAYGASPREWRATNAPRSPDRSLRR